MARAPTTYTPAISGARMPVTRPMRLMPPTITAATRLVVMSPGVHGGITNSEAKVSATVLAWMAVAASGPAG